MDFITDLHLHSKYSMAVSKDMNLTTMSKYASKKGIEILSTSDWTHPMWFREIRAQLTEAHEGLFHLNTSPNEKILFILAVEISCIFTQKGKAHRMHNLVLAPSFKSAEKINQELLKRGCNLSSDGRPIIGLTSKQLLELILSIDEKAMLIPCHIWTPWFSLFGANSGFESFEECFEELSPYVYGIETGLSSDPEMNWKIKDLDTKTILSFSDAHSANKMGREATVFNLTSPTYSSIREAIMSQTLKCQGVNPKNIVRYTIEFYPEEGKYHYNGHRNCNVYMTPNETREKGTICPVCRRKITIGVMQRIEDLSTRRVKPIIHPNANGLKWIQDPISQHPPFVKLVPLNEIIAESLGVVGVGTSRVKSMLEILYTHFGSELTILLKTPIEEIAKITNAKIAEGVKKVRSGNIYIVPGYDNVYGTVKIWNEEQKQEKSSKQEQIALF